MKRIGFALLSMVVVGFGCHDQAESTVDEICSIFCACTMPGLQGTAVNDCIASCKSNGNTIGPGATPECVDCVIEHADSCATIKVDCEADCDTTTTVGPSPNVQSACSQECNCQFPTGPASSVTQCELQCENGGITETCADCIIADATCNASQTCMNQCP